MENESTGRSGRVNRRAGESLYILCGGGEV
jgi:hypothetical protein